MGAYREVKVKPTESYSVTTSDREFKARMGLDGWEDHSAGIREDRAGRANDL
jgi:hypothetical protein